MPLCSQDEQQDITCLALNFFVAACYLLIFAASAVLLADKISKERERKWQILFHGFVMAGSLMRIVYFVLGAVQNVVPFKAENVFLDAIPAYLFFSSYLVLLFFWAELYHNNTARLAHFRPHYVLLNIAMYLCLVTLLLLDIFLYCPFAKECQTVGHSPVEIALHSLTAAIFFFLGCGYGLYGYRLYSKFIQLPTITSARFDSHRRVIALLANITLVFTVFFFVRTAMVFVWLAIDMSTHYWFDPLYYFALEVVPVSLLFYVFYRTASKSPAAPKTEPQARLSETSALINPTD